MGIDRKTQERNTRMKATKTYEGKIWSGNPSTRVCLCCEKEVSRKEFSGRSDWCKSCRSKG